MELFEIIDEINKVIQVCVEYGRKETTIEIVFDTMDNLLHKMNADYEYSVDEFSDYIPQFTSEI